MKKSNIIIICLAGIVVCWIMISGWMQAKAYNSIKSGHESPYANLMKSENLIPSATFKHIYLKTEKGPWSTSINICRAERRCLNITNNLKSAFTTAVSGDTLYIKVNGKIKGLHPNILIYIPTLSSLKISSPVDSSTYPGAYSIQALLYGFDGQRFSVVNTGQNEVQLQYNHFRRLDITGDFYKNGNLQIDDFNVYDSLLIDVKGKDGRLSMSADQSLNYERTKQWISIKLPGNYRVDAPAAVARKIIVR